MKKLLSCLLAIMVVIIACFSFGCNGGTLSTEEKEKFETAYLQYLNKETDFYTGVTLVKYAGEYDGNKVAVFHWASDEIAVNAVVTNYIVDDVLVCVLPCPIYDIIVYTADKQIKELKDAYSEGIITRKNLLSIKSALKNIVY